MSEDIVWFLGKFCSRYPKQNLLVIWNGAAIHCSGAVNTFLKERLGRIHMERLPAYSLELNPVKLLWSQLKQSLKIQVFISIDELAIAVLEQIKLFEKDTKLAQTFFRKKEIGFFTN